MGAQHLSLKGQGHVGTGGIGPRRAGPGAATCRLGAQSGSSCWATDLEEWVAVRQLAQRSQGEDLGHQVYL